MNLTGSPPGEPGPEKIGQREPGNELTDEQILLMHSAKVKIGNIAENLKAHNIDFIMYVGDGTFISSDLIFLLNRLAHLLEVLSARVVHSDVYQLVVSCQEICDRLMFGRPTAVKDVLDARYRTSTQRNILAKQIHDLLRGIESGGGAEASPQGGETK